MNTIRDKYDNFAPVYEHGEKILELLLSSVRKTLHSKIKEKRILEVGIGSGRSINYYKSSVQLTAGDLSVAMLRYAQRRALSRGITITFSSFDIENLPFKDSGFPAVLSSLVFCTVDNPVKGLVEIGRVLKPGGTLYMLEHVRPDHTPLAILFDWLNYVSVPLIGDHLNRSTTRLLNEANFRIHEEKCYYFGVFRLLTAQVEK
ncbi:class I SAM-dependent methyltransferase [Chitinispirillales bacterium ANBcel5]|uniref:class I SAM-dependent methyltransferase n=1 Tax=Cellulosispirillum alkaliphilum TaxID=3039283 RepID=UPI002A574190|nr:class I SAM-dependent methyltransferase [Chitinispirillales bacterium ANBcel5]